VSRDFIVTRSNSAETGRRKSTLERRFRVGPNAIRFVAMTIIAILAVVYLSQSTAGATRSIKVRDFESQQGDLKLQKERLEAEQTRLSALKQIDAGVEKQPLEASGQVQHLP